MSDNKSFVDPRAIPLNRLKTPFIKDVHVTPSGFAVINNDGVETTLPQIQTLPARNITNIVMRGDVPEIIFDRGPSFVCEDAYDSVEYYVKKDESVGLITDMSTGKCKTLKSRSPDLVINETNSTFQLELLDSNLDHAGLPPGSLDYNKMSIFKYMSVKEQLASINDNGERVVPFNSIGWHTSPTKLNSDGSITLPRGQYYVEVYGVFRTYDTTTQSGTYYMDAYITGNGASEPLLTTCAGVVRNSATSDNNGLAIIRGVISVDSEISISLTLRAVKTATVYTASIYGHAEMAPQENCQMKIWQVSESPIVTTPNPPPLNSAEELYRDYGKGTMGVTEVIKLNRPHELHASLEYFPVTLRSGRVLMIGSTIGYSTAYPPFVFHEDFKDWTTVPRPVGLPAILDITTKRLMGWGADGKLYIVGSSTSTLLRYCEPPPEGDKRPLLPSGAWNYFASPAHAAAPTCTITAPTPLTGYAPILQMLRNENVDSANSSYYSCAATSNPGVVLTFREPTHLKDVWFTTSNKAGQVTAMQLEILTVADETIVKNYVFNGTSFNRLDTFDHGLVKSFTLKVLNVMGGTPGTAMGFNLTGIEIGVHDEYDMDRPEGYIESIANPMGLAYSGIIGIPNSDEIACIPVAAAIQGLIFYNFKTNTWRKNNQLPPTTVALSGTSPFFLTGYCSPVNDCIYLTTNVSNDKLILCYNPRTDTFHVVAEGNTESYLYGTINGDGFLLGSATRSGDVGHVDVKSGETWWHRGGVPINNTAIYHGMDINGRLIYGLSYNVYFVNPINGMSEHLVSLSGLRYRNYCLLKNGDLLAVNRTSIPTALTGDEVYITRYNSPTPPDPRTIVGPYIKIGR